MTYPILVKLSLFFGNSLMLGEQTQGIPVASLRGTEGAACPRCHHFGVTPFYGINRMKKKTALCLTALEMFSTGMY